MAVTLNKERYESLDYFRGLCALSIMMYHYFGWTFGHFKADNILGRFGVYGVSLFYVLSGLTMFLVYFNKFTFSFSFYKDFYVKRFFRIFPLMWLVIVVEYFVLGTENTLWKQFIIASGLFSVFDWAASTPLGMWSIGNELSFYLLLPFIFWCLKKGWFSSLLISITIFAAYVYFAYFMFNPLYEETSENSNYKNPLNQAALFLGGILIGFFFKKIEIKSTYAYVIALIGLLLFFFFPAHGDLRLIFIGNYRIAFTLICFIITIGFFKMNVDGLNKRVKNIFSWLGEISYSLYLMHGLIWSIIILTGIKIRFVLPIALIGTFVMSHLVYQYIESPARNLGYKLLKNKSKKPVN